MGTKSNPGKFDCYEKAEPDEPRFTLLARDRHAPVLVALWAALREAEFEDTEVVAEALNCVDDMTRWALAHGREPVRIDPAAVAAIVNSVESGGSFDDDLPI